MVGVRVESVEYACVVDFGGAGVEVGVGVLGVVCVAELDLPALTRPPRAACFSRLITGFGVSCAVDFVGSV